MDNLDIYLPEDRFNECLFVRLADLQGWITFTYTYLRIDLMNASLSVSLTFGDG
jgi:hypothetical protein